ncbi:MAG: glycosyltransferase family 4 protein [Acidobacteria bacterium]|nr:glycosyltransferase family 4 protein [Acidobacteriota bacterium]
MKALQVLGGGAWGGGSVVVLAITKAMIARGDEVWVATLDAETIGHFQAAGARAVRPPLWLRPLTPLAVVPFFYLWWLCLRNRFDFVATHTSKGGFLGRVAARLAGVPHIVHHVHGFSFHQFTNPVILRIYAFLERLAGRCSDLLITVGEQHRQTAIELGIKPPDAIRTVLNGIDIDKFQGISRADARRAFGFAEGDLIIGSAGRLASQKGFIYAIRAMKTVAGRFPNARLVIAGEGPLEAALKAEAAALGVTENVIFLGFRRDVAAFLTAMDVFVHPSLWEGLSISLMEAMAASCTIVASDIWGNREMIRHGVNGLLVQPAAPSILAEALCSVLADPGFAARMASEARRMA